MERRENGPWPTVRLGDVLAERTESPDPGDIETGEIPIIAKISFSQGTIQLRDHGRTRTRMILVRPGDLVVSGINAAKGAIAIYDDLETSPVAATIHYAAYVPDERRADIQYLWRLLRSETFRRILNRHLPGGVKTELKANRLLPILIPLPPLDEQRRIVTRIEELAALIKEAQALRVEAWEEAKALWKSALRVVFFDWLSDAPTSTVGEACEAIVDTLHSTPEYSEQGYPCIRSADVGWGTLDLTSARKTPQWEYLHRISRGAPQAGDIVFIREGGGTGKAALVETGEEFSLGQRVMMLRPNFSKIDPKFLLFQLLSPYVYDEQIIPQTKGSASPHVNIGAIRQFTLLLPPLDEQIRVVDYLNCLRAQLDEIGRLQDRTGKEIDSLLPSVLDEAFRGELRFGRGDIGGGVVDHSSLQHATGQLHHSANVVKLGRHPTWSHNFGYCI